MEDPVRDRRRRVGWKLSKADLVMIGLIIAIFLVVCLEVYFILLHRRTLALGIENSV